MKRLMMCVFIVLCVSDITQAAEINNPQLTDYTNTYLRVYCDKLAVVSAQITAMLGVYTARDLGTVIDSGGAGNLITDGSATDGRTRLVGGDVYNFVTLVTDLQTFLAASGRLSIIAKCQVNGAPR